MSEFFDNAKYERNPSGTILVDGQEVAHTLKCCHCNTHFISVKGSGTRRGFCTRCMAVECGDPQCFECVPFEAKLDSIDGGNGLRLTKYDLQIADLTGKYKELRF